MPEAKVVAQRLGCRVVASESCVTAVYIGIRFLKLPFADMVRFVVECGGDTDTIGAMSGALWGAANGATGLPESSLQVLEQRDRLEEVALALYARFVGQ